METLPLKVFYLLRPLLNAQWVDLQILGFSFFELAGLLLLALLGVAFASSLMWKPARPIAAIEIWAVVLILWILFVTFAYPDLSEPSVAAKWIVPLLTLVLLRRVLTDRAALIPLLFLLLLGFVIPFAASAILTLRGEGLGMVVYWTGVERYQGVYANIHNMGHNAGFAMMLVVVYIAVCKARSINVTPFRYSLLAAIFLCAAYLLVNTQVRTVYIGLGVFGIVVLYNFGARYLFLGLVAVLALLAIYWSAVSTVFFDVVNPDFRGDDFGGAGSGRLNMWAHNLAIWAGAPLEHKMVGLGVGNNTGSRTALVSDPFPQVINSHNDWLQALMDFGLVGVALLVGLFLAILREILRLAGSEKAVFLALFAAVAVMNFLSNSYFDRFTLAVLFYMVMVYVSLDEGHLRRKDAQPRILG